MLCTQGMNRKYCQSNSNLHISPVFTKRNPHDPTMACNFDNNLGGSSQKIVLCIAAK